MRLLSLILLAACGAAPTARVECPTPADAGPSAIFAATLPEGVSETVVAAASAGKVVEAADRQAEAFDDKIVEIAKDPALSEQWAKVVADPSKARSAASESGLAVDLPALSSALRTGGVSADEVKTAIDGASKARLAPTETAAAFSAVSKAIEEYGPIEGFGAWFVTRVEAGDRGVVLLDAIEVEHQSKGKKVGPDKAEICHRPPGNPDNAHTISVGASAVSAHLGHGDTEGPCADEGGHGRGRGEGAGGAAKGGKPERGAGPGGKNPMGKKPGKGKE